MTTTRHGTLSRRVAEHFARLWTEQGDRCEITVEHRRTEGAFYIVNRTRPGRVDGS